MVLEPDLAGVGKWRYYEVVFEVSAGTLELKIDPRVYLEVGYLAVVRYPEPPVIGVVAEEVAGVGTKSRSADDLNFALNVQYS